MNNGIIGLPNPTGRGIIKIYPLQNQQDQQQAQPLPLRPPPSRTRASYLGGYIAVLL
jgi:hypothetical protein